MSTFSFSGIATGLDTSAIISQLMTIKRLPIVRLEERKSLFEQQKTALSDLETKLKALQDAVAALDTANEFAALSATSSNEDMVSVTASSLAAPGTYDIVVSSLATHQKDVSQGFSGLIDNVGTGSITITVGGEVTQINLTEPVNTLTDLRDAINDAGAGVNASILNDGSDTTPYRLILTSAESGSDAAFSADMSGLSGGTAPVMSNLTTAADASFTIDSIPVTSSSNSVTEAITGLTIQLHAADENTTTTVAIATDPEGIQAKVQTMVDAYNDLFTYIDTQSQENSTLRGHPSLRTISTRLQSLFTLPLTGSESDYSIFAQVGIRQGEGGLLNFDTTEFSEALSADYADVRDLFVERGANLGKAYLIRTSIDNLTDSVDGIFKIGQDSLNDKIENIDDTILRYERSAETYQAYLERKFVAMENMVAALQAQGSYLMSAVSGNFQ
jgi:flagellar hook-associated protein 2